LLKPGPRTLYPERLTLVDFEERGRSGDDAIASFQMVDQDDEADASLQAQSRSEDELPFMEMKPTLHHGAGAQPVSAEDARLSPRRLTAAARVPLAERFSGTERAGTERAAE
jgi:hypothetical protein